MREEKSMQLVECMECHKNFKYLTEKHLNKCCGLTTKEYLNKHKDAKVYSEEWRNKVSKENNPRYIDGRSIKKRNKEYKCSSCGSPITGRGKTTLCFKCCGNCRSQIENEIFICMKNIFEDVNANKYIVGKSRKFFPDILISPNIIIEVFGNYYHANPDFYSSNSIMRRKNTAEQTWEDDKNRIQLLEQEGYIVEIIWEQDWKTDKNAVIQHFINKYDWDSCSL